MLVAKGHMVCLIASLYRVSVPIFDSIWSKLRLRVDLAEPGCLDTLEVLEENSGLTLVLSGDADAKDILNKSWYLVEARYLVTTTLSQN